MDPKLTEISQLFERFKAAFIRNDFDTCSKLLSQLKVLLTEFRSLPPLFEETPNAVHELTLASNLLDLSIKYRAGAMLPETWIVLVQGTGTETRYTICSKMVYI
ncbi:hypothetical protein CsSME_00050707 [Camellia sinensis var. sinensis]